MSLAGFQAQNHPQQTGKRGARDEVDDRGTDQAFFDALSARFSGFTLDVAAAPHNAKCENYFTRHDDALTLSWCGRVWCNPPFSDLASWVGKAWVEFEDNPLCELIVMLVPANRTEQGWWQTFVEPNRDHGGDLTVEFLRGRMRFDHPVGWEKPAKGDRPPFGCCLLIWQSTTTTHPTRARTP